MSVYSGPLPFEPDAITRDVLDLVRASFGDHFGTLENFNFATTRAEALQALEHFITHALPRFRRFSGRDAEREQVSVSCGHFALLECRFAGSLGNLSSG